MVLGVISFVQIMAAKKRGWKRLNLVMLLEWERKDAKLEWKLCDDDVVGYK